MADNDISQYQQNGKQIFRPAIGKNVFSGTGTQLLQSKPGNTDANGQTNNARENELQKWLYEPFSWNLSMLETEGTQHTQFPLLFKQIRLGNIDNNHQTDDNGKADNDPCGQIIGFENLFVALIS